MASVWTAEEKLLIHYLGAMVW